MAVSLDRFDQPPIPDPQAKNPEPVTWCECCGIPIYSGQDYYHIDSMDIDLCDYDCIFKTLRIELREA
ncbi:MAG: hypothetical protein H0Z35_13675 [Thermoanaerobacteraceae bacterium]|nr:hypothetical protein [Thermoanaerobacteraceae bacterium]